MGVPADTDEITGEWLTAVLRQAGALDQARVMSIQSAPIGQLAFTGQIRRLQISYAEAAGITTDQLERCTMAIRGRIEPIEVIVLAGPNNKRVTGWHHP
jgi:hypothetical protein